MVKIIVLLIVVVLLIVGGLLWYTNRDQPQINATPAPLTQGSNLPNQPVESGNSIQVEDQEEGSYAVIKLVNLGKPGFLVLYKTTPTGNPGELLGHSELLQVGQHENLEVEADPALEAGMTYLVTLNEDEGDGDYDEKDPQAKDRSGNPIQMTFKATPSIESPPIEE